ncbi:tRNA isopentenyl-2-thiomethyl-A-37 hydroxylase MiaE [Photobacterium carnosum]|uniref:tRNA isopentenyl-2-thiomethyl-A-37 hydroxylase MiaE n=1 Tax=Photobacterium carnosum TaxID=2023717 RepID=UPI001E431058|nr:tRNA isopentenyl-2-thiomethyl-A-37 hydroxylase MiaE [Photobacterium carnosum]MCD9528802.1 tRNA-(ms[2]io[6]A)-hydroxylase [Photobacterium carnosum]MCF2152609.1 tRNA-(ms[2]io[6]A)-hydroxylase [Photobacterium carnosum]MCF2214369.1 tRNA-(ms[2]io[6]A)-hydroxylase [Photobacterium carnosum]
MNIDRTQHMVNELLKPINQFLQCGTPDSWIKEAIKPENLIPLLVDHCNCELKASQTAMFMVRKYAVEKQSGEALMAWAKPYEDFVYGGNNRSTAHFHSKKNGLLAPLTPRSDFSHGQELIDKMVRLIKEEFHHFEQVLEIMDKRGIPYSNLHAGRYAKGLMKAVRTHEPATLIDKLIVGAYIEARSCERFAKLAPYLDPELKKFYISLLRSEARHYQDYLTLAEKIAGTNIANRIRAIGSKEAELIMTPDDTFRFHSGLPATTIACV